MDTQMTLSAFCGSRLPPLSKNGLSNIVAYCQYKSQIKSLDQKGGKRFNTAGNDTKISRSMQYSQIVRTNGNGGGSFSTCDTATTAVKYS